MKARIAQWLRALADRLHPASRQPCVIYLDAERAYIDGVQYITWRGGSEILERSYEALGALPVIPVDIDAVHGETIARNVGACGDAFSIPKAEQRRDKSGRFKRTKGAKR